VIAKNLRNKFLDFFVKRGHRVIPNVSLIPENDSTALFISAGMHPLVPYLLGEPHPLGKRLCSVQRCLRTDDIDLVGSSWHHTFFEMLGNWSLGDYWKEEAISWSFEFLVKELNLDRKRIYVSCFGGDRNIPRDEESAKIWQKIGIPKEKIYFYGKKENWWGPVGEFGPCGPDTEIFYDLTGNPCGLDCRPNDNCGRFLEIWNNVFMEYEVNRKGEVVFLKQKNVDTGMGLERMVSILSKLGDDYQTELFKGIVQLIESLSGEDYRKEKNQRPIRIIADHARAATFLIADGVFPSNVERGYILRRLIRRAVRFGRMINLKKLSIPKIAEEVIQKMKDEYPKLEEHREKIIETIANEEEKFQKTLEKGLKEVERYEKIDGKTAFYLYETYGFPLEMSEEIAFEKGQKIDKKEFEKEFRKHQEISRSGANKKFAGGLATHSQEAIKLHTATHLLNASLRYVLGSHVLQKGSNITNSRLRFDFLNPKKLTPEELRKVEDLVNQKIRENLEVKMEIMRFEEARKKGAISVPGESYPEKVKVYSIGDFSCEICGGPHVNFTGVLGRFKIIKEEGAGAGIRRIYAVLE